LCLQFWSEGVRRAELVGLVNILLDKGDLDPAQRTRYKHIRARYKQLRFALMLYGARHEGPDLLLAIVAIMGHLQDAFRTGRRGAVLGHGLVLRVLIARPLWALAGRQVAGVRLDSAVGFLAWRKAEIGDLGAKLRQDRLTGPEFHAMRKIVSRQVSFYDARRVLAPADHDVRMSRFLSAINGLMGRRHDEMVEQAVSGQRDYASASPLADDIRQRLERFVAHYPL
jgi:hypothetical protein